MNCDETRSLLLDPRLDGATTPVLDNHLSGCGSCSAFARRFGVARELMRARQAEHRPDAYFAQRVSAAVPGDTELLGWAAARLLPATLALLIALTAWAWLSTPGPSGLVEISPTDDLLTWAIEGDGS